MKEAKEICPTTTRGKLEEGAILIDVRERNEVSAISIDHPAMLNIPLTEFENRYNEIPKDKTIVMVCKVGERSLRTTYFLMNQGYENVFNMSGGIVKWVNKDFPFIGDKSTLETPVSCCGSDNSTSCC